MCALVFWEKRSVWVGSPRRCRLAKILKTERKAYLGLVRSRPVPAARDHRRALGGVLDGVVQGDAPVRVGAVYADAPRYQLLHAKNVAGLTRAKDAGA